MDEFERGVRAGVAAFLPYLQNEDENSVVAQAWEDSEAPEGFTWHRLPNSELEDFAEGAITEALIEESRRKGRSNGSL